MKKLFLAVVLSFVSAHALFSQQISPYYPNRIRLGSLNENETQVTYVDFNFVSLRMQDFLDKKLEMSFVDTKYNIVGGKGTITNTYKESIAIGRNPRSLNFTYTVFPIGSHYVIKQLKTTGASNLVTLFFVSYWTTTLNINTISKTEIAYNYLAQDKASYYYNKGKTFVKVVNNTIKDDEKFIKEFQTKKVEHEKKQALIAKQEEIRKLERLERKKKFDSIKNTEKERCKYVVLKKKDKLEYEFRRQYGSQYDRNAKQLNFDTELSNFMADKAKGKYTIEIKYTLVYEKVEKFEFSVISFQKPRGLLGFTNGTVFENKPTIIKFSN